MCCGQCCPCLIHDAYRSLDVDVLKKKSSGIENEYVNQQRIQDDDAKSAADLWHCCPQSNPVRWTRFETYQHTNNLPGRDGRQRKTSKIHSWSWYGNECSQSGMVGISAAEVAQTRW